MEIALVTPDVAAAYAAALAHMVRTISLPDPEAFRQVVFSVRASDGCFTELCTPAPP
jgi:hypothetical protein